MIIPNLWSLSLAYDDEWADIDAKIEYERNIAEYVSKSTKIINRARFLFHLDLYSTCKCQSPHGLTRWPPNILGKFFEVLYI
jgi:hypothetical protein